MAEEEHILSWLSLKDFGEREIKIDPNWTGLEALAAVARLASEKLEEENITKEKQGKERKSVESNGYWRKFVARNGYEHGNSSRSCDDRQAWLPRVSVKNEGESSLENPVRNSALGMYSKKGIKSVAASDKHGSFPGSKDNWREREKALKKPVTNSDSNLCSKKKPGFNVASGNKLLGDAMKARNLAWKDDYDEEWRAESTKPTQTLERNASRRDNREEKDSKSNRKGKRERQIVPQVTPELPKELKEKIEKLNGCKINLAIQKRLYTTDVSGHHGRLSMPLNQILSIAEFLNSDERNEIDVDGVNKVVMLITPSLQESEITLTRWPKPEENPDKKKKKKESFSYVLITEWNDVKRVNQLDVGDVIQVWSFRRPGDQLCLALVLVSKAGKIVNKNNQNNHGDFVADQNNQNNNGELDGASSSQGTGNGSHDQSPTSDEDMGSNTTPASNPTPSPEG